METAFPSEDFDVKNGCDCHTGQMPGKRGERICLGKLEREPKKAARKLNSLGSEEKNRGLRAAAKALLDGEAGILAANQDDVTFCRRKRYEPGPY